MLANQIAHQVRAEMAPDLGRQRRNHQLSVGRLVARSPIAHHPDLNHQLLHGIALVTPEPPAGSDLQRHHPVLIDDQPRALGQRALPPTATALRLRHARRWLLGVRPLFQAAWRQLRPPFQTFEAGDLLRQFRNSALQGRHRSQQIDHQTPQLRGAQVIQIRVDGRLRHAPIDSHSDHFGNPVLIVSLPLQTVFEHSHWPPFLERQATLVNPLLPAITHAGFSGYWWVIDQCEYASDILFTERAALETIQGDLVTAAITALGATEVMHFLGRKPHPAFAGEVTIDSRRRPEGCRVRFRLKANAIKFYDHANVFRVETTINNPREFKVLRPATDDQEP